MSTGQRSSTPAPGEGAKAPHSHDHGSCIAEAVAAAEKLTAAAGAKLTPLRRAVLEIVWSGHAASGAYEILGELQARGRNGAGLGSSATPITVYRALEFLQSLGLVHRLESINAFIGCPCPGERHHGMFLICRSCRSVQELHGDSADDAARLLSRATAAGFAPERLMVELSGLCAACVGTAAHAHTHAPAVSTE